MPYRYFITLICCLPWLWVLSACKSNMLHRKEESAGSKSGSRILHKSTYLVITAAFGNFYKVLLPDRSEGFLPANVASNAPSSLQVKARFHEFVYVENGTVHGWLIIR